MLLVAAVLALAATERCPSLRRAPAAGAAVSMKGKFGYRKFDVSMWYPNADLSQVKTEWVSAFAPHHLKLQQLEQEVEHCEFMLDEAIANENYDEADGLRERVERLRGTHPIWSVEEQLSDAISSGDFEAAKRHHTRLEDIRWNLGLPRFLVGQVVLNRQSDLRAVVVSVDIRCEMGRSWVQRCCDANALRLEHGLDQPFYTCLVDSRDDSLTPRELYVVQQNRYSQATRPAVYLPEEALEVCHNTDTGFEHPLVHFLFDERGPSQAPNGMPVGLGVRFKPTLKLRLWQRAQLERMQELRINM